MPTVLHKIVLMSPSLAEATKKKYLKDLDEWERFAGGDTSRWTRQRAGEFYHYLIETKGLAPQSANRLMASIRYATKWWSIEESRPELNFAIIQLAKSKPKHVRPALTQDQAEQLIYSCARPGEAMTPIDMRDLALIVIGLETGMRRMSIEGMNFENYTEASGYPAIGVPIKGHAKDLYPVPLSDTSMLAFNLWSDWLAQQNGGKAMRSGPVFRRLTKRLSGRELHWDVGEGISISMVQKILARRSKAIGINHVHPHLLRHTFITWREMARVPTSHIAAVTGHIVSEHGQMGGYMDRRAIGALGRQTTPEWLATLVQRIVG